MSYLFRDINGSFSSEGVENMLSVTAKKFKYNINAYDEIIEDKTDQHGRFDYRKKANRIVEIKKFGVSLMTIEFDRHTPGRMGVTYRSLKGISGKKTVNKFLDATSLF